MPNHPGSQWLQRNWNELPPDRWVAANATGLVAESPNFETLLSQLSESTVPMQQISIAFVTFDVIQ